MLIIMVSLFVILNYLGGFNLLNRFPVAEAGIFMFQSGMALSGVEMIPVSANKNYENIAEIKDGIQVVTTKLLPGRYETITVEKGTPVRWTIEAENGSLNGCNNAIIIPELEKEYTLSEGENLIEFIHEESGIISYSCWMGMIRSRIVVGDDIDSLQ